MAVLQFPALVTHIAHYPKLNEYVLMANNKHLFSYCHSVGVEAIQPADVERLAPHDHTLHPIEGDAAAILADWRHRATVDPETAGTTFLEILAGDFPMPRIS